MHWHHINVIIRNTNIWVILHVYTVCVTIYKKLQVILNELHIKWPILYIILGDVYSSFSKFRPVPILSIEWAHEILSDLGSLTVLEGVIEVVCLACNISAIPEAEIIRYSEKFIDELGSVKAQPNSTSTGCQIHWKTNLASKVKINMVAGSLSWINNRHVIWNWNILFILLRYKSFRVWLS